MTARVRLIVRILVVTAAAFLVVAFALAALFPPAMPLAQLMAMINHPALVGLQDFAARNLPPWAWNNVVYPVLVRPSWLLPAALGLVSVGLAVTLNSRPSATRPRRRRS